MFYKKQFIIIALILLWPFIISAANSAIQEIEEQIKIKEQQITELKKQAGEYKQSIRETQIQENTLANQIKNLNNQIYRLELEIKITQTQISQTGDKIIESQLKIEDYQNKLQEQKENLTHILRVIHQYDQESPLEIILKNNNFSELFDQIHYIENLQNNIQLKLENIKELKKQLEIEKENYETKKLSLEELNQNLSGQNLIFNGQKNQKENLLRKTKNQERVYQNLLKETQVKSEEIQKDIFRLEDKLRLIVDPNAIPAPRSGLLSWPINGIMTQGYGPTSQTGFINDAYQFHNGIDINANLGDPIKAALGGRVVARGDNGLYAYGKWIAIDHENGLITLYAHLSEWNALKGQSIEQGSVIGYTGRTGYATGVHLHFTVYAAHTFHVEERWFGLLPLGGSINPLNYL